MASKTGTNDTGAVVKRRGLLRFGTLITALTGASAISSLGANSARAAPPTAYIPIGEKGAPSGVATLDAGSKIPVPQLPDLSTLFVGTEVVAPATGSGDREKIQGKIDAAAVSGKPVRLPKGTYWIDSSLVLPSGVTIEGAGPETQIITGTEANCPVFVNSDAVNGNSKITIRNLLANGNRANQSGPFSAIKMVRVSQSLFENLWVCGGKRTTPYPLGHSGEALEFVYCTHNKVHGGKYFETDYDGIKLRSSHYTSISDVLAEDCGKSGVQLAYAFGDDELAYASASTHNTVANVTVTHSTGIPANQAVSPQTTGITFHAASHNVVAGLNVYGTQFGISTAGSHASVRNNIVNGGTLENRVTTTVLGLNVGTSNNYSNLSIRPISGESKKFIVMGGNRNVVANCNFEIGSGTGIWTDEFFGESYENTMLWNMHDDATYGGPADGGVRSMILERGRQGNYGFGITKGFGSGIGVVGLRNATKPPTASSTQGALLYSDGGALKVHSTGGTQTLVAGEYVAPPGAYTITAEDRYIIANGATITIGSPATKGRVITVKNISATTATVQSGGVPVIDGAASISLAQWQSATLVFSGTNWLRV